MLSLPPVTSSKQKDQIKHKIALKSHCICHHLEKNLITISTYETFSTLFPQYYLLHLMFSFSFTYWPFSLPLSCFSSKEKVIIVSSSHTLEVVLTLYFVSSVWFCNSGERERERERENRQANTPKKSPSTNNDNNKTIKHINLKY